MKNSIGWHKECLANILQGVARRELSARNARIYADKLKTDAEFLARQIQGAEKLGKDGFDSERFMRSTRKAVTEIEKLWANRPQA